jgi:hypothetical protein
MNTELMLSWLRAMVTAMGHGGKSLAARKLGLSPSGLSKLLNTANRGFDEKTARCAAWIVQSKSDNFKPETYPVTETTVVGPVVIETRQMPDGVSFFYTWKVAGTNG